MAKTLDEHYGYLADDVKRVQYSAAIEAVVQPGDTVLDLGCGSGLLGLMALEAGASKVIFVDEGAIIEVARRAAAEAGFSEKSEFVLGSSFELELDGRADVVLCDHVGYFGIDYGILALLEDAKARFLKPGGTLVPSSVELLVAPVETDAGRTLVDRWRDDLASGAYAWVAEPEANTKHALQLAAENLLAEPSSLADLELGEPAAPMISRTVRFTAAREGRLDGIAGWFDCRLHDGVHMTNSPLAGEALDRPQAFLPLADPVPVRAGDEVDITVMIRHLDHVIAWVVELPGRGERHTLSTFNGMLLDREMLMRTDPDRLAKLNARGKTRLIVLSYCDGLKTVGEIEALVKKNHPDLFPSEQATSAFIRQVLAWDTSG